ETNALTATSSNHFGRVAAALVTAALSVVLAASVCATVAAIESVRCRFVVCAPPALGPTANASIARLRRIVRDGPARDGGTGTRAAAILACIISSSLGGLVAIMLRRPLPIA